MPDGAQPGTVQWLDFDTGEWTTIPGQVAGAAAAAAAFVAERGIIKFVTLMMSSAIIGKGGSDTGELIVACAFSVPCFPPPPGFRADSRPRAPAPVSRPPDVGPQHRDVARDDEYVGRGGCSPASPWNGRVPRPLPVPRR